MQSQNQSFYNLSIAPKLLEILTRLKFTIPTPIQQKAIPIAIEGKDIIGIAQTGTGKTLAFGIPMVQRLEQTGGRGMVLVPTRELAFQVHEALSKIAQPFGMHTCVLIGGAPMHSQIQNLKRNPRIIVATPGRLMDHLQQRTVQLTNVKVAVVDEADRMFDMGFAPQVEKIMQQVSKDRQTLLFSATMPPQIVRLISSHMKLPIQVEIAPAGTTSEGIVQELFIVRQESKNKLLAKLLDQYHGTILLFSHTKRGARKITKTIRDIGHSAAEIHSDRSMAQRRQALEGFKSGRYRILVATDIASRGIDVTGIELVINYDLPQDAENYVHRIGRTGRAGLEGRAISFATPHQADDVRSIEKLIRAPLPISEHPEIPLERFVHAGFPSSGGFNKGRGGGNVRRFRSKKPFMKRNR
jgi:ATP-dependent RNA helicase RhlE